MNENNLYLALLICIPFLWHETAAILLHLRLLAKTLAQITAILNAAAISRKNDGGRQTADDGLSFVVASP
jgi:hypothetical protein